MKVIESVIESNVCRAYVQVNNQLEIRFCNYGAALTDIFFSDKFNNMENIVVSPEEEKVRRVNRTYAGAIVGPLAGRYDTEGTDLEQNRFPIHFHGGSEGFDTKVWQQTVRQTASEVMITYTYEDAAVDVMAAVVYTVNENGQLSMEVTGSTTTSAYFNPTNHVYFNLNGCSLRPITNHFLRVEAEAYYAENEQQLITGDTIAVQNQGLDFRTLTKLDYLEALKGINTTFQLMNQKQCELYLPDNGRRIQITTTLPAVVIYTFNQANPMFTTDGIINPPFSGITFETQQPANQLALAKITKSMPYYSKTTYLFCVE